MRLGIIFGGRSGEHEISLLSAASVVRTVKGIKGTPYEPVTIGITKEGKWLLYEGPEECIEDGSWQRIGEEALKRDPQRYSFSVLSSGGKSIKDIIDFALPILHGPYGEDGTIQGLFEMIGIPYGGSGVTGSALAMDKLIAKGLFDAWGIPQVEYREVMREEVYGGNGLNGRIDEIEGDLGYPLFVKPANMGSSVGINKATNREELIGALKTAAEYDRRLVVERGIDVRELEIGVLGNYEPKVSAIGEIIPSKEFYDYTAKYLDGGKSDLCIPADISREIEEKLKVLAIKAYKVLDCAGFARVDFFMDKKTGEVYVNEINSIPGFTRFSMFPRLWEAAGVSYPEQIERIIELGYERYNAKNHR
ncbi:MAG: D-alanine--D-alanine ligase family protein [Anaerovoracaceae bacterium]|jgi:D-alanine-D-alanine ligase